MFVAAQNGHEAVVHALIELGGDPRTPKEDGATPVYMASEWGHEAVVRALVEHGFDPCAPRNDGSTPLDACITGGHVALARTLRVLVAESGHGACVAQEFGGASWLTPLRRFVLGARLGLRVDCPSLVDAAILSLVEVAARERTPPTASLVAEVPHHLRERVLRQSEDHALRASVILWRAHASRAREGVRNK
jgi:hypothetical protein